MQNQVTNLTTTSSNSSMEDPSVTSTTSASTCLHWLMGKKFDVLCGGKPNLGVHFIFKDDGKIKCNQRMFDKAPYKALNANQFEMERKNGTKVLWQFKDSDGKEAFRTDRPLYGMRLAKKQK